MKKRILSLTLALITLLSVFVFLVLPANAAGTYLIDDANVISATRAEELEQELRSLSEKYNCRVMIVTVKGQSDYTYENYAIQYANQYDSEGIILFMQFPDIRAYQFEIRRHDVEQSNRERAIVRLKNTVVDYLSENDNYGAYKKFVSESDSILSAFKDGKTVRDPYPLLRNIIIALVAALIIGLIYTGKLKKQLITVEYQKGAANYVKNGSMNLKVQKDIYLYSTTTRTARPKNTSSGGGVSSGGSRGSGGSGGGGHY